MVEQQQYRVIVTGKKLIDSQETIRQNLLNIFDLPDNQLKALLGDKPFVIKKNIPPSQAMKFKKALTQCGLECHVESMDDDNIDNASDLEETKAVTAEPQAKVTKPEVEPDALMPVEIPPVQPEPRQQKAQIESPDFFLAPVGSRIGPRPALPTKAIPDTEHLSAGFSERLSPEREQGPAPPDVSHIDVAPVGATLGSEKKVKPLDLDLSHIQLKQDE